MDNSEFKWPLDYVLTSLWFLGSEPDKQIAFLSKRFKTLPFDGDGGVMETGNPLIVMLHFCRVACKAGISWEEWDNHELDEERDQLFRELHGIVIALTIIINENDDLKTIFEGYSPHIDLFSAARRYANNISKKIDWGLLNEYPVIPCETILFEESRGLYEKNP